MYCFLIRFPSCFLFLPYSHPFYLLPVPSLHSCHCSGPFYVLFLYYSRSHSILPLWTLLLGLRVPLRSSQFISPLVVLSPDLSLLVITLHGFAIGPRPCRV